MRGGVRQAHSDNFEKVMHIDFMNKISSQPGKILVFLIIVFSKKHIFKSQE